MGLYDYLTKVIYDEERKREYSPLSCMNDNALASRVASESADPCIYSIKASQSLNSSIALNFRRMLVEEMITFLVPMRIAEEEVFNKISEYTSAPDAETQLFYERPFLETQAIISESISLTYTKQSNTGNIVVKEQSANRKDHYSSCSYLAYFCSELEKDMLGQIADYEFQVFIN